MVAAGAIVVGARTMPEQLRVHERTSAETLRAARDHAAEDRRWQREADAAGEGRRLRRRAGARGVRRGGQRHSSVSVGDRILSSGSRCGAPERRASRESPAGAGSRCPRWSNLNVDGEGRYVDRLEAMLRPSCSSVPNESNRNELRFTGCVGSGLAVDIHVSALPRGQPSATADHGMADKIPRPPCLDAAMFLQTVPPYVLLTRTDRAISQRTVAESRLVEACGGSRPQPHAASLTIWPCGSTHQVLPRDVDVMLLCACSTRRPTRTGWHGGQHSGSSSRASPLDSARTMTPTPCRIG